MFTPLTMSEVHYIVVMKVSLLAEMLKQNNRTIILTDKALYWLSRDGCDPIFGARPVKCTLQKYLINEMSKKILSGKVASDGIIKVDFDDLGLVFLNE